MSEGFKTANNVGEGFMSGKESEYFEKPKVSATMDCQCSCADSFKPSKESEHFDRPKITLEMDCRCSYTDGFTGIYELAVKHGFEGDERDFLLALKGDTPELGVDYFTEEDKQKIIDSVLGEMSQGGGVNFVCDETLSLIDGVLSVNTAEEPEPDNTLPITSAAVASTVGNIAELLKTI